MNEFVRWGTDFLLTAAADGATLAAHAMHALQRLDMFHLRAAEGWLELGNAAEARRDLGTRRP